ncbi:hypothetical protein GGR88_000457 [Sphingomonas jejuensis]|uniref:Uncharacterized protein n=1 Tax=Sphingomonas jejuensis TaxID=904715 RepID=A0ABX0XI21_9SPHN|nr:hypothetical protein [Sphingomonas jejuensis]NJC32983.1 hypothetical protein [Sphingomonas jejuensis]
MFAAARKGAWSFALLLRAAPAAAQTPPPLLAPLEFFQPTPREHSVSAKCGTDSVVLTWAFDGEGTTLLSLNYAGRTFPTEQLDQMQAWIGEIGGDVLIDVECAVGAASFRIIEAQAAGTRMARQIQVHWSEHELYEFARYNFDGVALSSPATR